MNYLNPHLKTQLIKGISLGFITAIFGVVFASSSTGRWLEEEIGMTALFKFRGYRPGPQDVVIVSMDSRSSQVLELPNKPRKWPRSLHGRLVDKIAENGASVIAFDVIFDEERSKSNNRSFAGAIRRAQNVILYQYLKKLPIYQENSLRKHEIIGINERLVPPVPVLRDAALGLAHFPLPKVPARVNHFPLFTPALGNLATLPVLVQLTHSLDEYEIIARLLKQELVNETAELPANGIEIRSQQDIHTIASTLRELFIQHPELPSRLLKHIDASKHDQKLHSLINTLALPDSAYLNFYGPPGSIKTIPYYRVLESDPNSLDLKGKAVLVGFSEGFQPEQADAFYTVFTDPESGLDISGVEIAATALSNLLEGSVVNATSTGVDILILLSWGLLLGLGLRVVPGQYVIPITILLSIFYGLIVYRQFVDHYQWLPFTIPLLIQAPFVMISSLLWKFLDVNQERKNIRHAFGYHLPKNVVDQLAQGVNHITASGQHVYGIVMSTDAEQYTNLSESLPPADLRNLMNHYYETLFTPIRKSEGIVSDVVGDAALAIWASNQPDINKRQQACQAAIEIVHAVDKLNAKQADHALPTRLGLHFGEVVMGHVGAVDHYEYRAVGDIVNTATRIEGLNKLLGTRIIVSEQVLEGLVGFTTRELGKFILVGKKQPLTLFELVSSNDEMINYTHFENAVRAYQANQHDQARQGFINFISSYGHDGPSEYYLELIEKNKIKEPEGSYEVIKLTQK